MALILLALNCYALMLLLIIILRRTAEEDERSINHMGMAWQGNPGSEERRSLALSASSLSQQQQQLEEYSVWRSVCN